MGFRFRKSVRLAPGVPLNLSKSGTSLSLGGKGVTTNIRKGRVRTTYSLPGTGISYSSSSKTSSGTGGGAAILLIIAIGLLAALFR